ncbi:hypothetical protein [Lentzea terrae]|uniref:hypothetical protein n=1 Tax=Lentzea terrae TaxID=2200761 RepID=UPI0013002442|nr:hypothetical protein [Lentzea terrae]
MSTVRQPRASVVAQSVPRQFSRHPVTVRFTVAEQLVRRESVVPAEVEFVVVARTRAVLRPLRLTGLDRKFDVIPDLGAQR